MGKILPTLAGLLTAAALCILWKDELSSGYTSLVSNGAVQSSSHHAGKKAMDQKSQLAFFLKQQLNDQVKDAENSMFHSALTREGVADELKKEGFPVLSPPSKVHHVRTKPRHAHAAHPSVTAVKGSAHSSPHNAQAAHTANAASRQPYNVKLAKLILAGKDKLAKALPPSQSEPVAHQKSKLVLKAVLEARSSPAGRHRAAVDEELRKSVVEADAITHLTSSSRASSRSASSNPPALPPGLAEASALMAELDGNSPSHRATAHPHLQGAGSDVERALRAQLDANVARKERVEMQRSLTLAREQATGGGASPAAALPPASAKALPQSAKSYTSSLRGNLRTMASAAEGARKRGMSELQMEKDLQHTLDTRTKALVARRYHPRRPAARPPRLTQAQMESKLRSSLDQKAKGLQQADLYRAELAPKTIKVRPPPQAGVSPAQAIRSTFGGLNIKRSPEMALEAALRQELNDVVRSQESSLFRRETGAVAK
mmetsp:Transcript_2247/g.5945  ORF Transcript_2247/g.5945 Transcript_2247/m.5945 type:complete len:488 (+) Transcript_2247:3-1466(+)